MIIRMRYLRRLSSCVIKLYETRCSHLRDIFSTKDTLIKSYFRMFASLKICMPLFRYIPFYLVCVIFIYPLSVFNTLSRVVLRFNWTYVMSYRKLWITSFLWISLNISLAEKREFLHWIAWKQYLLFTQE